jgi:predicted O-linked N-acetylglucosamine transferase (SPINDLY family)
MDYVVGDKYVTPPEHQGMYSEMLALMPWSYQINYYDRHVSLVSYERSKEEIRAREGLPEKGEGSKAKE